jgi:protease II
MNTATSIAQPPVARIQHTETHLHRHTLVDDYAWLREKESPEVIAYLEAENAYCAAAMEATAELQKELYAERKPTSLFPSAMAISGTTPAPNRARNTPSTAASPAR